MHTITLYVFSNGVLSVALGFLGVVIIIRIVRWILDILP
jgi:hypothetical protein